TDQKTRATANNSSTRAAPKPHPMTRRLNMVEFLAARAHRVTGFGATWAVRAATATLEGGTRPRHRPGCRAAVGPFDAPITTSASAPVLQLAVVRYQLPAASELYPWAGSYLPVY